MVNTNRCMSALWIILVFMAFVPVVQAEEQASKLAVMPFVVRGPGDQANIRKTVEEVLVKLSTADGIQVVDPQEVQRAVRAGEVIQTEEQARAIGRGLRADYVLMGSFNQVGNTISLDARLVHVAGQKRTESLFAEDRGMENLAAASSKIVQQVSVHLLEKAVIADVKVVGGERIEAEAVKAVVKSKKGEILRPEQIREDIRAIYAMGYFEKVDAQVTDTAAGKILTFVVQENPTVQEIRVTGQKKVKEKDILAAISTRQYTVLQPSVVNDDVQKILKLYQQKGYHNADVKSSIEFPKDPRKATVTFAIKEGKKVYIKKITFTGNKSMSARKLRGVMQTKEKGFLSLFTERGILQREILETDTDRLTVFYHDQGFMDARVGKPEITLKDDGFRIDIPVDEGERYKVSDVRVRGDMIDELPKIEKKLELKPKGYFSREKVRSDMDTLSKAYMDEGYARVEVTPLVKREPETKSSDVTFEVKKNDKVRIGRVFITGNTKTRDNVIRREIQLFEGDYFSSSKLERSLTRLKKLDYFEDVQIEPVEAEQPHVMNLHVKVREKLTGSISVGGGFSSDDGLFASGQIMQRNLFGKGQYIGLKAYFGQEAQRYIFSFTEPWLFGKPLAGGFDVYNWLRDYNDFTKDATGVRLRTSYPFGNYSRGSVFYTYEEAEVTDVDPNASDYLKSQEGRYTKSSVTFGVERDTTDHHFLATRGMINAASVEFSSEALGSSSDFVKTEVLTGIYFPLFWKFVGFVKGEFGYLAELDDKNPVPIYERFFLGGINSLRGFKWGDVGPKDDKGEVIGGTKYGVLSAELLFPIYEKMGVRGVLFFDAGNAYLDDESFDISKFRTDAGAGIRWNSPFGPLRLEVGYNLDPEPGEDSYQWQFSAGAFF